MTGFLKECNQQKYKRTNWVETTCGSNQLICATWQLRVNCTHARAHILQVPASARWNKAEGLLFHEVEDLDHRQDAQRNWLSKARLVVGEGRLEFCRNYWTYWFVLAHSLQHTFNSLRKNHTFIASYAVFYGSPLSYTEITNLSMNYAIHQTSMQQWWSYRTEENMCICVPVCTTQTSYGLPWNWTRASEHRNRQLTSKDMAWHAMRISILTFCWQISYV